MKHLLKGLLWSVPWWGTCAVYTYCHMSTRPILYASDPAIWLYCFCCGVAFTYIVGESAHEEERREWEAMHTEVNHQLISRAIATHAGTNGHKQEVTS